nr:TPA_inf: conotoxin precursor O1 [Conus judaeus]
MKLTCVLIISVLFLAASQLITADYTRNNLRHVMQNLKGARDCGERGEGCYTRPCCPGLECIGGRPGGLCQY